MADRDDEQDKADGTTTVRPMNDAYTGMLIISLLALVLGCVLLYLDWSQYPSTKGPDPVNRGAPAPAASTEDEGKKEDGKKDDEKKDEKKDDGKKAAFLSPRTSPVVAFAPRPTK